MESHTEGTELPSAGNISKEECRIPGFEASSQRCREISACYSRRGNRRSAVTIVTAMLGVAAVVLVFATLVYIVPHIKHGLHFFHQEITDNHSFSKQEMSTTTPSPHLEFEMAHHRLIYDSHST
jgi:hypothetical protein